MQGRMTLVQAREWLRETDDLRAEYRELSVIDDKLMRSSDRKRFNTLSCILTIRNQQCEDILRAVVTMEAAEEVMA